MPSPSTASQSRINAERLAHLLPKGNPPDSIRPEHALGQVVGYIQEYSDTLFKFLLETKRPARTALLTLAVYSHNQDPNLTFDQLLSCKQALYPPACFKQALT